MAEAEGPTPLTAFEVRGAIHGLKTDLMELEDRISRRLDASDARTTAHEIAIDKLCRRLDKLDVILNGPMSEGTRGAVSDAPDGFDQDVFSELPDVRDC